MSEKNLMKALQRAGITDCKIVSSGVLVFHDYCGPYPTRAAIEGHNKACKVAIRNKLRFEQRGHYSATLIFC